RFGTRNSGRTNGPYLRPDVFHKPRRMRPGAADRQEDCRKPQWNDHCQLIAKGHPISDCASTQPVCGDRPKPVPGGRHRERVVCATKSAVYQPRLAGGPDAPTWRLCVSRLLVVDDDIQMLSALEAALRHKGHTVETASNGIDAASKLENSA